MRAAFAFLWASICHALIGPVASSNDEWSWSPRLAESETRHEETMAYAGDNIIEVKADAPVPIDRYF